MESQSQPLKRTVKRQRSENWLEEDKIILKELVRERVAVLENKNTDANTNAKKVAAWNDLRTSFNNMANTPRTLQQIKAQWGIIKMFAKKQKYLERKMRFQTGGGPPPASEPLSSEDISAWLPHEFSIDSNEFDSDNQNLTEKIDTQAPEEIDPKPEEIDPKPEEIDPKEKPSIDSPLPCESEPDITEMTSEPSTSTHCKKNTSTKMKPSYRPKNKKITVKDNAVLQIAETEISCRKQLHEAQMANEKQKLKNLKLKEEVLKSKLEYYKNKLN